LLSCAHKLPISHSLNPTHRISHEFSQIGSGEIKRGFWLKYGHGEAATGPPNEEGYKYPHTHELAIMSIKRRNSNENLRTFDIRTIIVIIMFSASELLT